MYQLFFSLIFYFSEDFAPVIENCSSDIAQDTDPGAPYAIVTWMEPVGSDANGAVTTRANYSPGNIFPLGTTVINYEVTDRTNNTANCSFRVTISGNVVVLHWKNVIICVMQSKMCFDVGYISKKKEIGTGR